jgi:DNA-binding CsgD family transcriptional regulator
MGRSAWGTDTRIDDYAFALKMKLRVDQMRVEEPASALTRRAPGKSEPRTEREQEILACLADQLSNHEIANKLHLAEKTVRCYNTQIYGKLGAGSRKEAIEQARMAVFRGGFTHEAAQAVAAANRHSLRALSNKALIEVSDGGRYGMHELLQQFVPKSWLNRVRAC